MQIANHKLVGVNFRAANASGGAMTPTLIVTHDTAGRLEKGSSVEWFASKDCGTSAHLVVERDGSITQMVPFNRKAFHAGRSVWKGREFCNSFSIGIEIVNPGELNTSGKAWFSQTFDGSVHKATEEHGSHNWLPYTTEQIEAVKAICKALADKYEIEDVTAHWFISPKRKIDPNPLFPLEEVKAAALGGALPTAAPVAAVEMPKPAGASVVDKAVQAASDHITLDWLIENGSRIAKVLQTAKRWFVGLFWGTTTVGTVYSVSSMGETNGTVDAAGAVAGDHLVTVLICVNAALFLALAALVFFGIRFLLTAARDGRYQPPKAVA